ncbi:MAG: manganese efflux pump MntP family protein [Bacillota bacterium]
MNFSTVMLVAVALGTDAFALAVGIGVAGITLNRILIASGVVCLFHIFMPLIGLGIGLALGKLVGEIATVIGAIVLILIGLNMLWEVYKERKQVFSFSQAQKYVAGKKKESKSLESFWGLIMLAGSVSLDALSVGIGLGTLKAQIFVTVLVLGIVAGIMTATGFFLGRRLGGWLGEKAEIAGGLILAAVGVKLLF